MNDTHGIAELQLDTGEQEMDAPTETDAAQAAGVFICGRQHSGNTMLAALMGGFDSFVSTLGEEIFFEYRARLESMPSAVERARWMSQNLNLERPEVEAQIGERLCAWAAQHPSAGAIEVFQKAGAIAVDVLGKRRWSRKATSYIFHADTILREMPNVKLIYIMRNPFDLSASLKRRSAGGARVEGTALSWNRGVQLALRYEKRYPDRVHVIRYEKLVSLPEEKVKRLCRFLDEPYRPTLLDVPHINTSDKPYELMTAAKGMSKAHLFYYMDSLTDAEILATQLMASRELLRQLYPDLPHLSKRFSTMTWIKALGLVGLGLARYPFQVIRHARKNHFPVYRYLSRRLKIVLAPQHRDRKDKEASKSPLTAGTAATALIAALFVVIFALAGLSSLWGSAFE